MQIWADTAILWVAALYPESSKDNNVTHHVVYTLNKSFLRLIFGNNREAIIVDVHKLRFSHVEGFWGAFPNNNL